MADLHDTGTCPVCAPHVNTGAYRRGETRAAEMSAQRDRDNQATKAREGNR